MNEVSDLTAHTGYWLRMVSNAVSQDFARKVAAEGVTVAEWTFLRALYDAEAMTPSALADRMGMSRGAISKLADRLVHKALISRDGHADDRRMQTLSLTAAGRDKVPALAALADRNDAEYFGVLGDEERAALGRLLRTLADRRGLKTVPVD